MKLIRFGPAGAERPGVQLPDGRRIDASGFGEDYDEGFFGSDGLERLALWVAREGTRAPEVGADVRLGPQPPHGLQPTLEARPALIHASLERLELLGQERPSESDRESATGDVVQHS